MFFPRAARADDIRPCGFLLSSLSKREGLSKVPVSPQGPMHPQGVHPHRPASCDPVQSYRDAQMQPYAVGAAISRPQAAIRYKCPPMRKCSPITVGEGLAPPSRGNRRFSPSPGRICNTDMVPPGGASPAPTVLGFFFPAPRRICAAAPARRCRAEHTAKFDKKKQK